MLAIDTGSRRVGLAVSDEMRIIAQPLRTVPASPTETLAERIVAVAREVGADEMVVGLPRRLDGSAGAEAAAARSLADRLRRLGGMKVELLDERLTSVAAERSLLESGLKRRARRQVVDAVAASLILEVYLASRGRRS